MVIITTGTIKLVAKNERYRVLKYNSNYVLIDCDRGILGHFCFLFNWLLPVKVYPLSKNEADDLLTTSVNYKAPKNNHLLIGIFLFMSVIIIPGIVIKLFSNVTKGIFLNLLIISFSILCIRIRNSRNNQLKRYSKSDRESILLTLRPITPTYYVQSFLVYLLLLFVTLLGVFLYVISNGYWTISLAYTVVLYLFSLTNRLAYNSENYQIFIK